MGNNFQTRMKLAQALASVWIEDGATQSKMYVYNDDFEDALFPKGKKAVVKIYLADEKDDDA